MLRVSQANLNSVMPTGAVPTVGNAFQEGWDRNQQRTDTQNQREQADQEKVRQRRNQAIEAMAADPVNAEAIAQMHGIEFDDNMRKLFSNKEAAHLTVQGAKIASSIGIANPAAAREFVRAYVASKGDMLAANGAIQGMALDKPQKPSYSHIKSVDGSLVDVRTGEVLYRGQGKGPSTTGLSDGYMWEGGQAVPIPGYNHDPYDDPTLPPHIRAEGIALKEQMGGSFPVDPGKIDAYMGKVQQIKGEGGQPAAPAGMPPLPQLPHNIPDKNINDAPKPAAEAPKKSYKELWD